MSRFRKKKIFPSKHDFGGKIILTLQTNMFHVSKVSLLRVRQVESGKKLINFYKQGVENLRFEQRDFNFVIQFVWERD